MSREDFEYGHATVDELREFMLERHRIWQKRQAGEPAPWTTDPVLGKYRFTNIFRQLDKGTLALNAMLQPERILWEHGTNPFFQRDRGCVIVANIIWYRSFNRFEHATDVGFCYTWEEVMEKLWDLKEKQDKRIFTSAHMTTGRAGEDKLTTYAELVEEAYNQSYEIYNLCCETRSIEQVFYRLQDLPTVGRFIAYEMACDLRFQPFMSPVNDSLTWANMGPGAKRGMRRLGMEADTQDEGLISMQALFEQLRPTFEHFEPLGFPFELREVEHSLCEFDKYCRATRGEGRPRQNYKFPE